MARKAVVPPQLRRGAFSLDDAQHAGLDRWHLRGSSWTRLAPRMYVWSEVGEDPMHRLEAARRRLPAGAAFSGLTAAWLHGIDVAPCDPIEATVCEDAGISARVGIALRRSTLDKRDVVNVRGMRATSIVRTVCEVCSTLNLVEAVVVADQALHGDLVRVEQLRSWAKVHSGHRGIRNLRSVIVHAEPAAESPMESRLRMVLILGGLPRPKAQVPIHDRWHRFVGRPDLYYEDCRLGIEYDGGVHRESLAEDNRRQNKLLNAGVRLLRFTAADVLRAPDSVVSQVCAALANPPSAGAGRELAEVKRASAGTRGSE